MKFWILFLLASFVLGVVSFRRQRRESFFVMLALCLVMVVILSSTRWV